MADETPVTTATARLIIKPDTTEYDEFKRRANDDIDEIAKKLAEAFRVKLEIERPADAQPQDQPERRADEEPDVESGDRSRLTDMEQVLVRLAELVSEAQRHTELLESIDARLSSTTP